MVVKLADNGMYSYAPSMCNRQRLWQTQLSNFVVYIFCVRCTAWQFPGDFLES